MKSSPLQRGEAQLLEKEDTGWQEANKAFSHFRALIIMPGRQRSVPSDSSFFFNGITPDTQRQQGGELTN